MLRFILFNQGSNYSRFEHKLLEHYNDWVIVKFLDNKTSEVELDNSYSFILVLISTHKAEIVDVNGNVSIASNDEAGKILHCLVCTCPVHSPRRRGIRW